MRIAVISDLHGATDHLRRVGRDCDTLLVLGDLINVIDYHHMEGILVDVFGREPVARAVELRGRGRIEEAREALRVAGGEPEESRSRFVELARRGYEEVFDAMPANAVITFGNVDIPDLVRELAPTDVRVVDAEVVELDGERFGFVGGGLPTPLHTAGEVDESDYDAKLDALGPVDVVCTHIPPAIPWYVYDVLGKRFEPGSRGLVAYMRTHRPRRSYFGHVHQPLVGRGSIGGTELVNVGYFRGTGTAVIHEPAA